MDVTDIKLQTVEIFWEREKKLLKLLFFLILFLCCDVFVTSDWHGQTFSNPGPSKMERDKKCKQHNGRRKSKNLPNDENEWTCRLVNSFFLSLFCSELSLEKIFWQIFQLFPLLPHQTLDIDWNPVSLVFSSNNTESEQMYFLLGAGSLRWAERLIFHLKTNLTLNYRKVQYYDM